MVRFSSPLGIASVVALALLVPVTGQQQGSVVPAATPMAISQSGQFTIYGGRPEHRGEFVNRCESLSRDVANVTGQTGSQWVHPFVVQLKAEDTIQMVQRRAVGRVFQLEPKGFRFQMDVLLDPEFQIADFNQEFIKLLLMERMFDAARPEAPADRLPSWILVGVAELIEYRRAGRPSDIFSALMDARQVPPVSEIISSPLDSYPDSVSRGIFRACSAALVQSLLDQGSGSARFMALLSDLAYDPAAPDVLLRTHFPALNQAPDALAKWWTLQLAEMSERSAYELLPVAETERLLAQSLRIDLTSISDEMLAKATKEDSTKGARLLRFSKKGGKPAAKTTFTSGNLEDFTQYLPDPRASLALRLCDDRLNHLAARCFPLHRPILASYSKIISRLQAGDTEKLSEELQDLTRRRNEILTLMEGVSDYMNWYVTTQVKETTDDFAGYGEALKSLQKLDLRKRQDPISVYLDAMERELAP